MARNQLTEDQAIVIENAFAALVGALEARNSLNFNEHDWDSHLEAIEDMVDEFGYLDRTMMQVPRHEGI